MAHSPEDYPEEEQALQQGLQFLREHLIGSKSAIPFGKLAPTDSQRLSELQQAIKNSLARGDKEFTRRLIDEIPHARGKLLAAVIHLISSDSKAEALILDMMTEEEFDECAEYILSQQEDLNKEQP